MKSTFPGNVPIPSVSGSFTGRVSTRVSASVVAVLTVVDVGGRTLPTLLARLLDSDVVPGALSLLLGILTSSDVLPAASPFLLYGYLVYTLAPRLFPGQLRHVTEQRGFRLTTAGYALLVPLLAVTSGPEWDIYLPFSGLIVLPLYLIAVQRGAFLGRDGYPVATMNAFFLTGDKDLHEEFEDALDFRDRTLKYWALLIGFGCISVTFSWLVIAIVGVLLFFLSLIYPVPELLLFGWVGQRALLRGPIGPDGKVLDRYHLDLETRILTPASEALKGLKGFASVGMSVLGLGMSVISLWISIFNVWTFVDLATRLSAFSPARLVLVVVGTLTLWGLGLYGFWYWMRLLTRVSPFLDAWRAGLTAEIGANPEPEERFLPTRPPGYFLPPMLLWWMLPVMHTGTWESPRLPPAWEMVVWLVVVALNAWSAYRGVVSEPQQPHTDQRALPVSFFFFTVGWWVQMDLTTEGQYDLGSSYVVGLFTGRVSVDQFFSVLAEPPAPLALAVITVLLYLFWFDDVFDWRNRDDWWRYVYIPYWFLPVVVCGIVAALVTSLWQRVLLTFLATVILGLMFLEILKDFGVVDIE